MPHHDYFMIKFNIDICRWTAGEPLSATEEMLTDTELIFMPHHDCFMINIDICRWTAGEPLSATGCLAFHIHVRLKVNFSCHIMTVL